MSRINVFDAISYLENVSFELAHSEEFYTQIGTSTFKNLELNDNIIFLTQMMKFVLNKNMEKYQENNKDIPNPQK